MKYPVRLALNPFISTIAWLLPNLVSGSIIVAIVLNLPTAGPLLLQSLMSQDMYLAGAFVLLICALTLVGIADQRHPARAGRSAHPAGVAP